METIDFIDKFFDSVERYYQTENLVQSFPSGKPLTAYWKHKDACLRERETIVEEITSYTERIAQFIEENDGVSTGFFLFINTVAENIENGPFMARKYWKMLKPQLQRIAIKTSIPKDVAEDAKPEAVEDQDDEDDPLLSSAKLAERLGITKGDPKRGTLSKRLESWRNANPSGDGWIEVEGAGGRKPKYLYSLSKVWNVIKDMKTSG